MDEVQKLDAVAGQVSDVRVILARMETKLDKVISDNDDHETRLRALERTKWLMVGAATAAGGLAGRLVGLL